MILFKDKLNSLRDSFKEVSNNDKMLSLKESFNKASIHTSTKASLLRKNLSSSVLNLPPIKKRVNAEIERRRNSVETYTCELQPSPEEVLEVIHYISEFYRTIYTRTDEINELLRQYPDTLGKHYDDTADTVQYEDFWLRYFYRCDEERIQLGWKDILKISHNSKVANNFSKAVEVN